MGLLDTWSQRATARRAERMEFVGGQAGSAEDPLKRDLTLEFTTRPGVLRAYLLDARFGDAAEPSRALCVRMAGADDPSLVTRVGEIYRRRFGSDAVLDIVFLTAEQDAAASAVSRPFFARAA